MSAVTDLVARLREAIDETEQAARAAQDKSPSPWKLDYYAAFMHGIVDGKGRALIPDDGLMESVNVRHIVRHDPAAVLRRCAADRKILDLYVDTIEVRDLAWNEYRAGRMPSQMKARDADDAERELAPLKVVLEILAEAYGVEA